MLLVAFLSLCNDAVCTRCAASNGRLTLIDECARMWNEISLLILIFFPRNIEVRTSGFAGRENSPGAPNRKL